MILGQWGTLGVFGVESPPVVARVAISRVLTGEQFTLYASGSEGAESYLWEQVSGPSVVISSPSSVATTQLAPIVIEPTSFSFRLTVSGSTASDSAIISSLINVRLKPRKVIRVY